MIVLENRDAGATFGPRSPIPYLAKALRSRGAFLPRYFGIAHRSLPNYLALVSGQPPNPATQADCPVFEPLRASRFLPNGVVVGEGCVYPPRVRTVGDQLQRRGLRWRAYMQDLASSAAPGEPVGCRHPAIGARDPTQEARPRDQYATRHDPFVYFRSLIDFPRGCRRHVVDLRRLSADLRSEGSSPAFALISPDLCADGHDAVCADPGAPGGPAGVEAFLRRWVPRIERSAAYRDHGAILITFDESASGAGSCCREPRGPSVESNGGPIPGNGGGRVGAVVLSPCVAPGTVSRRPYNHYTTLRWIEDSFGLPYLGYAAPPGPPGFGADVFTRAGRLC
ncbi:MAG: alkaline phosphatase family protein [Syntrophothermus sp.]